MLVKWAPGHKHAVQQPLNWLLKLDVSLLIYRPCRGACDLFALTSSRKVMRGLWSSFTADPFRHKYLFVFFFVVLTIPVINSCDPFTYVFRVPSKTKRAYPAKFMVCIVVYIMHNSLYTLRYIPIYHTSTFLLRVRYFYFVIHEWSHLFWEPGDGSYVPRLVVNVNMSLTYEQT